MTLKQKYTESFYQIFQSYEMEKASDNENYFGTLTVMNLVKLFTFLIYDVWFLEQH